MDTLTGAGEAPGIDDGHETAQQLEIQHGAYHLKIHLSLFYHLISK
jgi:hypothetical protein